MDEFTKFKQEFLQEFKKFINNDKIHLTLNSELIEDLKFDSIQLVELINFLEGRFEIRLFPDELVDTITVENVAILIYRKLISKNQ